MPERENRAYVEAATGSTKLIFSVPPGFMRAIMVLSLILAVVPEGVRAAPEGGTAATITPAGSIVIRGGTVIPAFPKAGGWAEFTGKSSDRYETRHFMYMVPNEPPAIELYVATDRRNEPPDGVFEIGVVTGYFSGFASKAGLRFDDPVFEERYIGPATVKRTLVKLSDDRRTLRVHAYIYPRKPSLTFIAIRTKDGAQEDIERYLAGVELK
ncbi:MAG: hypothetical protein HY278_07435 [candidate division NC10 bacterium]|nr:hypothetical protein [candidate division NC10 bacterium]